MTTIDEQERQRGLPEAAHSWRISDHCHYRVIKPSMVDGVSKRGKGVEATDVEVYQICVMVFLAGWVLLRATMVVQGKQHSGICLGSCTEPHS